jgi:L-fuculose-phosphate aldolase
MGSPELAEVTAEKAAEADVLLLENHGILTTGKNLLSAFDKIEVLENAAKMTLIADITGRKKGLSSVRLREIERLFR